MRASIGLALMALLFSACETPSEDTNIEERTLKTVTTRIYSVKMVDGLAQRDTLNECFSCNQSLVFDEAGKEKELRYYKANLKEMLAREEYGYDIKGNKRGADYFEEDSLTVFHQYEVDSLDLSRVVMGRAFDSASRMLLYAYRYSYDDKGNIIQTTNLNELEEEIEYYNREFNDQGLLMKETIVDFAGQPSFNIRYEYRPEAKEDWVEQLVYYNEKLSEIRVREKAFWE